MSEIENREQGPEVLDDEERRVIDTLQHGSPDLVDQAVISTPDLTDGQKQLEISDKELTLGDAPQFLLGKEFLNMQRITYVPASESALTALAVAPPVIGCCGLDYNMVGVSFGPEGTRDDYFANKDNGRTFDGKGGDVKRARASGHYRGEVSGGTSRHTKTQDVNNNYKANFPRVATAHGFSLTSAESTIVPYVQAQGGYMWTFMQGKRDGQAFVYDKGNVFVGAQLGIEANVAELFKIGVSANLKVVPSGTLDNIPGGTKKADHLYGVQVYAFYIIQ